jgi:hypothetical protein
MTLFLIARTASDEWDSNSRTDVVRASELVAIAVVLWEIELRVLLTFS